MKIELLTIGNELLLGFTTDTNSVFLSRELAAIGVEVVRQTSVGDVKEDIAAEVAAALSRTGAVITSGGLGPTSDDISVESVAYAFGRDLVEDPGVIARMEQLFRSRGYKLPLTAMNRRQALIPTGAEPLENRHGTAPGIWMDVEGEGWVALLPGVPRELKALFLEAIRPRIVERYGDERVVASRTLRTTGIAEASLAELVVKGGIDVHELAYLPGADGVDLRVTVRGKAPAPARSELDADMAKLRSVAGERAYGEDDTDLAAVVLASARQRSLKIAVAESCTGGLLGARLSAVAGASDVFVGGIIAYSNDVKMSLLGVRQETLDEHGAVSEATVREMAAGVCAGLKAQIGIAISGIAGPAGGSAEKPIGTVCVAVLFARKVQAATRVLPGDRAEIRQRAAQMALDMTRVALLGGAEKTG